MEVVYRKLGYYYADFWNNNGDRRVQDLVLMTGGPWTLLLILGGYLLLVTKVLPSIMKHREAFELRTPMIVYNVILSIINALGCFFGLYYTNYGMDSWSCACNDDTDRSFKAFMSITLGHAYFITKLVDLLDTVFFVLRKRHRQVSGLHLFHHTVMPIIAWTGLKFFPSGNSAITPLFNSFVHFLMYAYYAMAASGPKYRPSDFWKRQLTHLQLVQFVVVGIHSFYSVLSPTCCWPKLLATLQGAHSVIFFVLFSNFYVRTYSRSAERKTLKKSD